MHDSLYQHGTALVNRDTPTSNLLQDILDKPEWRIWFLYEASTGSKYEH